MRLLPPTLFFWLALAATAMAQNEHGARGRQRRGPGRRDHRQGRHLLLARRRDLLRARRDDRHAHPDPARAAQGAAQGLALPARTAGSAVAGPLRAPGRLGGRHDRQAGAPQRGRRAHRRGADRRLPQVRGRRRRARDGPDRRRRRRVLRGRRPEEHRELRPAHGPAGRPARLHAPDRRRSPPSPRSRAGAWPAGWSSRCGATCASPPRARRSASPSAAGACRWSTAAPSACRASSGWAARST